MIETDENPPATRDTALRRRIGIALSVLTTVIIGLTIVLGMKAPPMDRPISGGVGVPSGLLFLRNSAPAAELWLAAANGGQPRLLAPGVSDYSSSPDGTRIIYATQTSNAPSRIEIYDRTTLTTQVIVQSPDFVAMSPRWSPVAGPGVIAYERSTILAGSIASPKLWLVKEDGTDLGAVLRGGAVMGTGAKWSPDGSKLAFVDPLRSEIVLFNFSDEVRRLPFNGEFDWAPDSSRLVVSAFSITPEGVGDTQLFLYDLATASQQPLFASPGSSDSMPVWSPDGSRIAFVRRSSTAPQGTIWVGTLADGRARSIHSNASQAATPFVEIDPQWSLAGDQLIWTRLSLGIKETGAIWRTIIGDSSPPGPWIDQAQKARWIN